MTPSTSSKSFFKLKHGDFAATISCFGAALTNFTYKNQDICVTPEPWHEEWFAGATLAPWPNRLDQATWRMKGQIFKGKINEFSTETANHGLVYNRAFDLISKTTNRVVFSYGFGTDSVYPFAVTLTVAYALSDAGLSCEIKATNADKVEVPIAFGSHPFFALDDDSAIRVEATTNAVNNQRKLPVGYSNVELLGLKPGEFVRLAKLELDHCVDGFGERTTTTVSRPTLGLNVGLTQSAPFKYQMLFLRSAKLAGNNPATLSIEPLTSPPNALMTDTDLIWLEPGATSRASWSVSVSAT